MAESKRRSPGSSGDQAPDQQSMEEIVRRGYEAWNSGDLETMLAFVHPDMVWATAGVFPGLRPSYAGHAGFREFWSSFMEPWETLEIEIEELVELDPETMLIRVRFHAVGRQDIEVDRRITNHLVMRDEQLYRFKGYADWEQALADLGIEDPSSKPVSSPE